MKNKIILLIINFVFFCNISFANNFIFKTKKIEILEDEKKIIAGKGVVINKNNGLEIYSDKFEYLEDLEVLKSKGNGKVFINDKNIIIKFDFAEINEKKSTLKAIW